MSRKKLNTGVLEGLRCKGELSEDELLQFAYEHAQMGGAPLPSPGLRSWQFPKTRFLELEPENTPKDVQT